MAQSVSGDSLIRVTLWGLVLNLLLAWAKLVIGIVTQSYAVVGDGLHSLFDGVSDGVTWLGLHWSMQPRDQNHLYGHHKFVNLFTLLISILILAFSAAMIYFSTLKVAQGDFIVPSIGAVWIALISFISKEWLYQISRRVARRENSQLVYANALHHRADAWSSVLVIIALVVISLFGAQWAFLDKLVGFFLGLYLLGQSFVLCWKACLDLLDTAPKTAIIDDIREHILPTQGVFGYHDFRIRRVGDLYEVDFHLQVNPNITVEAGHQIVARVRKNIMQKHQEVFSVVVQLEPATQEHMTQLGISGYKD